jgi:hypothetical protein
MKACKIPERDTIQANRAKFQAEGHEVEGKDSGEWLIKKT